MRYLIVCLLLCGCSGGTPSLVTPGKTARQAIMQKAVENAAKLNITSSQGTCLAGYLDRNLTDQEAQAMDAAASQGTTPPQFEALILNGIASCTK